ncbi:hypothetical protein [Dactylosporangium sp. CS-033363]
MPAGDVDYARHGHGYATARRHGHLRTQPTFAGSLRLLVGRP